MTCVGVPLRKRPYLRSCELIAKISARKKRWLVEFDQLHEN